MKKAQLEFIGLAVIVLLVSLGLLLAIRFILFKKIENPKPKFDATQMSSNFINTLTETTTTCKNLPYKELLAAYFDGRYINCGNFTDPLDGDIYLLNFTEKIINNTLKMQQRQFLFEASSPTSSAKKIQFSSDSPCTEKKTSVEKFFVHPTGQSQIYIKLRMCYAE